MRLITAKVAAPGVPWNVAVPVLGTGRRQVRCAVALQAPAARMPLAQALQQVPRLGEAAQALGRTWA